MGLKSAVSVTLRQNNLQFIDKISKQKKKSKSEIVDCILDMYRKFMLKKDIMAGFKEQTKEDAAEAMSDFGDYLKIVKE